MAGFGRQWTIADTFLFIFLMIPIIETDSCFFPYKFNVLYQTTDDEEATTNGSIQPGDC
jgi:hypothetical protein